MYVNIIHGEHACHMHKLGQTARKSKYFPALQTLPNLKIERILFKTIVVSRYNMYSEFGWTAVEVHPHKQASEIDFNGQSCG